MRRKTTGTAWDKKLVQVSTDGVNWMPLAQISGANKQWTLQTCDLGAYAGRAVKIRFLFDTLDAVYNTYRGWYVDDVQGEHRGRRDRGHFRRRHGILDHWAGTGLWRRTGLRSGGEASGTNRWAYNRADATPDYNTGARNSGALVSCWIDLAEVSSATLAFKSWYRTGIPAPPGIASWCRSPPMAPTGPRRPRSPAADQQWTTPQVDLGAYAGQRIRVRFFFDTIDALNNATKAGTWMMCAFARLAARGWRSSATPSRPAPTVGRPPGCGHRRRPGFQSRRELGL
jgi:hypothetical protein